MSIIYENLDINNILLDVEITSKKRALERAALMFENNIKVARSVIFDGFFDREKLGSTALGSGVAVPHARLASIKKPILGFIRFAKPLFYDTPDGEPVKLMMFLISPEKEPQNHLEPLAELARVMSDASLRERLFQASTPEELKNVFKSSC
ncbi:PTS sugar transporter subunit IIA [Basilea psittacipulmonis]|uniref:PTS EIIA type-2 domain-containing protein n=1 Tax=Basilea psittacipulmonis DSM 24701 TaxID=1072685 RepID=A0A077DB72_9BURK|nr:PTS sugar transporter subunit IIA [Basilea psittacipulmonis]AIL32120.1 hypothetical protein IX83_01185 [Basilea psittacipulmonis DSM 24701]